MMKEKGITLISLIITIIIMMILAGAGIATGMESIHNSEIMQFNSEMRIINTRVNELVNSGMTTEELNTYGYATLPINAGEALQGRDSNGFRYFDKISLERIGVTGINREVLINFTTREVIDLNGIEIDGEMVYILEDWQEISFRQQSDEIPSFSLEKRLYGLNANIIVNNTSASMAIKTINYKLNDGIWHETSSLQIPVNVSGTYTIKVTNVAGNVAEQTIDIVLTNPPKLEAGMTPVMYDENQDAWIEVTNNNINQWYDYSDNSKWACAIDEDDVVWIWIPRFIYHVTDDENDIRIKYLKGQTSIATDNTNETISTSGENGTWKKPKVLDKTHDELTGIWVQNAYRRSNIRDTLLSAPPPAIYAAVCQNGVLLFSNNVADINTYIAENNTEQLAMENIAGKHYRDYGGDIPFWRENDLSFEKAIFLNETIFTSTSYLFYNAWITEIEGLRFMDTSNVEEMQGMFYGCSRLKQLDLSSFDTSNVTNMAGMFSNCLELEELDLRNFDTSKVTKMAGMFSISDDYDSKLKKLDISSFNTSMVNNMSSMFAGQYNLTTIDVTSFDTHNVTDMTGMFDNCMGIETLDLSRFDTRNVTSMTYMFRLCFNLETIYASPNFITTNVGNNYDWMFYNCRNLCGGNGTTYNENYNAKTYARIDTASTPGYFTLKTN